MPTINIRTSGGGESFTVDQATVDRCVEQLKNLDAVLRIDDEDGTAYIPARHVVSLFVAAR
ncbi:hypothetical protein [Paractinoplanes toevensis]|uniref:Uncharacterized protein n=1 Tax=Paractinoplanes toevensis TaxID=571911 RepID=A0A919T8U9_9ACTN|nr:hypothetical protein [Actinoplanes toevensis]GIM89696.1 hypothetical protein Ato02nite_014890 [Actinoplanes toevensis]